MAIKQYVFALLADCGCKYTKYIPMLNEKDEKKQEKGILYRRYTWEQGKRYGQTGSETACNRERDGISLNSSARTHELGRAPLYLGAPALIRWSGRSKPSFIPWKYHALGSRANNLYHYVKHHLQLSCTQVAILVAEIFQLLEALLTAFCWANIEQRLAVLPFVGRG